MLPLLGQRDFFYTKICSLTSKTLSSSSTPLTLAVCSFADEMVRLRKKNILSYSFIATNMNF